MQMQISVSNLTKFSIVSGKQRQSIDEFSALHTKTLYNTLSFVRHVGIPSVCDSRPSVLKVKYRLVNVDEKYCLKISLDYTWLEASGWANGIARAKGAVQF